MLGTSSTATSVTTERLITRRKPVSIRFELPFFCLQRSQNSERQPAEWTRWEGKVPLYQVRINLKKIHCNIWFADVIGEIVLEPQPKCDTNTSGQSTYAQPQPNSSEESLTLLHYYRNYVTHRELVHIEKATMYVEVNRTTRETKIVERPENDIECIYLPIQEGDWIKVPEDLVRAGADNSYRTLKKVLSQLRRFVMGMVTSFYMQHRSSQMVMRVMRVRKTNGAQLN